jgi:hypothetical protein
MLLFPLRGGFLNLAYVLHGSKNEQAKTTLCFLLVTFLCVTKASVNVVHFIMKNFFPGLLLSFSH